MRTFDDAGAAVEVDLLEAGQRFLAGHSRLEAPKFV